MTRSRRELPNVPGTPPEPPPEPPPETVPETPPAHPETGAAAPVAATPAEPKPAAAALHSSVASADAPEPAPETLPETPPGQPAEAEPPPPPQPPPEPPPQRGRGGAGWLALALVLVVVLLLASPFWAPAVMPLLPWGAAPAGETRVAGSAVGSGVDRDVLARLDRLETAQRAERPAPSPAPPAPDLKPALDRLDRRIAALEARPAPPPPPDLGDIRQQLGNLSAAIGDLAGRVGTLEKTVKAEPASAPVDAALALTLLQIREAVDAARPFAAEYETLVGLARNRPELEQAAAPLAGPAKTGVASRAVLVRRLHELAGQIAGAEPPPAADDWGGQIVARLRSLVTVRRVAGPGLSTPEAAVSQAERAMTQGDLAGAVAALDGLEGAPAEAAQPWLRMARARLQVETALRQTEAALAARLKTAAQPADQPR